MNSNSILNWINTCLTIVTVIITYKTYKIAYSGITAWKQELKARKLYEQHYKAYNFLSEFKYKLTILKELDRMFSNSDDEIDFNHEIMPFLIQKSDLIKELQLNLCNLDEPNTIIRYILDEIINKYITTEQEELVNQSKLNNNFCTDYFETDDEGQHCKFYANLNQQIDDGIVYFNEQLQKFFK